MEPSKINVNSNPCKDFLTDLEYLEHMIPHHQVAIDMSHELQKKTTNARMLHLCRDIVRKQGYEIWEMEWMYKGLPDTVFSLKESSRCNTYTKLDIYYPKQSKSKDGDCNPLFFDPDGHSQHMKHVDITEKKYLEHMIPHHQVAIDMSKRLLLHTNNSYLMDFCNKLIVDQQGEIFYMNQLLKNICSYSFQSELLYS
jgi:uncharacterized protein (DUF305 family)